MAADLDADLLREAHQLRRSAAALVRRLRARRAPHGVSGSKLSILGWLVRAKRPLTASRLAELERLQPQSLTRIVAELDEAGLIRRRQDEADRRQLLIEITTQGLELLAEDARRQNRWLAEAMLEKLTRAERDILTIAARLLDELTAEESLLDPPERSGDPPDPPA
jgi:DNA-binding MarR family transcriptional regulator